MPHMVPVRCLPQESSGPHIVNSLPEQYERMFLIRSFEELLGRLFFEGRLTGTMHSCAGQEAVAVGVIGQLDRKDPVIGNHRSHGHYLARSDDLTGLLAEIMGKSGGVVGGRGGSQHFCGDAFYCNGIQGSMVPVAAGMALAEKKSGGKAIVTCFIGDGTLGQGVVYESLNLAGLWQLPILFVLENNGYAMSTPVADGVSGSIPARAQAFGIAHSEIDGNDVSQVAETAGDIIDRVRRRSEPYFLVANTYRFHGHSKSDDCCYRTGQEEEHWAQKDPLILSGKRLDSAEKKSIEAKCLERLQQTLEQVEKMPDACQENPETRAAQTVL